LLYWVPAILYMAGIFVVSSIPDLGPLPGGVSDKSGHGVAYAGLGILMLFALVRGRADRVTFRRAAIAVALATAYGVTDEWHQFFVPGRSAEVADVVADAVGATLGVALAAALARLRTRAAPEDRT
jgi:VanZ family protein